MSEALYDECRPAMRGEVPPTVVHLVALARFCLDKKRAVQTWDKLPPEEWNKCAPRLREQMKEVRRFVFSEEMEKALPKWGTRHDRETRILLTLTKMDAEGVLRKLANPYRKRKEKEAQLTVPLEGEI